jgi:chromosome segregation ATPase
MADNSAALRRARRAGVSVSLLYADAGLSSRIATARDRQRQAGTERAWKLPARSLITEHSLRAELANTRNRARRLTEEVALLHQRLSRHLGTAADIARGETISPLLEQLEQRAAELETDNHRQRQRIAQLETETRELAETLNAARAMNRELMTELNHNARREDTRPPSRPRHT